MKKNKLIFIISIIILSIFILIPKPCGFFSTAMGPFEDCSCLGIKFTEPTDGAGWRVCMGIPYSYYDVHIKERMEFIETSENLSSNFNICGSHSSVYKAITENCVCDGYKFTDNNDGGGTIYCQGEVLRTYCVQSINNMLEKEVSCEEKHN